MVDPPLFESGFLIVRVDLSVPFKLRGAEAAKVSHKHLKVGQYHPPLPFSIQIHEIKLVKILGVLSL